jgi:hypothetical protein
MFALLAYLGAVAALCVGAIFGLMVLLGGSAEVGKNLAAYSEAKTAAGAKPAKTVGAEPDASAAARTTGLAPKSEKAARKEVRAKASKGRAADRDKRKKQTAQIGRERR